MRRNHDIIEIEGLTLRYATNDAYLFITGRVDEQGEPITVWIPKSQCDYADGVLQLPEWMAVDKGLV